MTSRTLICLSLCALTVLPSLTRAAEPRVFGPEDLHRLKDVSDAQISPEGEWVAYVVRETDVERDRRTSDLYMVRWDGSRTLRLTHTEGSSESRPRFSPDGRYLGFLAARDQEDGEADGPQSKNPESKSQVWLLDREGGEARRLTELPGGVSDFSWSPDGSRLALIGLDPEDDVESKTEKQGEKTGRDKTPKPIVIDRYLFKRDRVGYLGERRNRLYVFDVEGGEPTLLTPGAFDNSAPIWSPDGKRIAFVSKRAGDPDRHNNTDIFVIEAKGEATPVQLTTWEGPDAGPAWSPDGRSIAYFRDGPPKYSGYDHNQLAISPAAGGEPRLITPDLDRDARAPLWAKEGSHLYFLLEDDRIRTLARVPSAGGTIERFENHSASPPGVTRSFALGPDGKVAAVITRPQQPAEVFARDEAGWRALSDHNRALLDEISWATVEGIEFESEDGTEVRGMLLKPPGYQTGKRYPTVAYIHGGPVGQDGFEFDATSQGLAAAGYLVVNPNYRGSSGRGNEFSRAIYADWGNLEIQDIHAAVDHLVEAGLADPERLGIGGWSYGGMNTNYAIATDTRFRAAVSGAAISNMITGYGTDQYVVQYENEVGLPWQELDVYFRISYPFFHADRIETPTLFLCGEKDFNVPLVNSEQMYQALRSLGVPTQLVIYPKQFHGLSKPSYLQDRLERMLDWYGQYLKEEPQQSVSGGSR